MSTSQSTRHRLAALHRFVAGSIGKRLSIVLFLLVVSASALKISGCDASRGVTTRPASQVSQALACSQASNPIATENAETVGVPDGGAAEWDIPTQNVIGQEDGDPTIQGFATDISVNRGSTIHFKIKSTSGPAADPTPYTIEIYRLGYYGGKGARKVGMGMMMAGAGPPQSQAACMREPTTKLVDCGNWNDSAFWDVPPTATSGVYIAKLHKTPAGAGSGTSHIIFVVCDDTGSSDILFQTADTTWQAYNNYDDVQGTSTSPSSLYTGATKVSYNRPFNTRGHHGVIASRASFFFTYEYPMLRWLEANGYNVSYFTAVDAERNGALILGHKAFLSVGHDEYWSANQRANVKAARDAHVNLAFFSGNEMFWKTRWESSSYGGNTAYRTLVSYKENEVLTASRTDPGTPPQTGPDRPWTGTWRDPSFSPPSDGANPANALTGTEYVVEVEYRALTIPPEDGKMRFWRGTEVKQYADLGQGVTLTGGCNCILGHEWNEDSDNGFRPAGLIRVSTTTTPSLDSNGAYTDPRLYLLNHSADYGEHRATHHLTMYRSPAVRTGALVFSAGTTAWSWGLDSTHDTETGNTHAHETNMHVSPSIANGNIQQATVNLFADMCDTAGNCIQPRTLQTGLACASPSTDSSPPSSTISAVAPVLNMGVLATIQGTASDPGGRVGGVEVSVDGGLTWHPANGRTSWTYSWRPTALGTTTIKSRAVDDTGNLETLATANNSTTVNVQHHNSEALLFYNKNNGSVATGTLDAQGNYQNVVAGDPGSFAQGWTHIVKGLNNVVFFYNKSSGTAHTGMLSDAAQYTDFGNPSRPLPLDAKIAAASNGTILFYRPQINPDNPPSSGYRELGRLYDDGVGAAPPISARSASFSRLSAKPEPPPPGGGSWSHIVVGLNNVVLYYDENTGNTQTAKLGMPTGSLSTPIAGPNLGAHWSKVVVANNNVVLLWKHEQPDQASVCPLPPTHSTGTNHTSMSTTRLNADGTLGWPGLLLNSRWCHAPDALWTHIVAGVKHNVVLFYHDASGTAVSGILNSDGTYTTNPRSYGFSPGWTSIVSP